MLVRRHANAAEYLDAVSATLVRKPVINQLAIAIAQTCVREPERYGAGVLFYSVEDAGEIQGAALQTPPWPVQVSVASTDAARMLARAFAELPGTLSGVAGPDDTPGVFADEYGRIRGVAHSREQSLGTFELTAVTALPRSSGRHVVAEPDHAPIVQTWLEAFHAEAVPHDPPLRGDAGLRAVATGRAYLWLDERETPVSYAFNNRDVEGWASIGPVYTPPELRGHGFATTLVAEVSQRLLDQGRPGCTLFTNLANPTSNKMYERIGYRRVGTSHRYAFS
jgi:predicted GNAT family acetyltransferase